VAAPAPEISVLLPVRDAAATLREALDSTLASVGARFEVVCVDDGSSDGSAALLDDAARRDARVRVVHTPPRGLVAALGEAVALARAPLFARMDADDEMHPERLAAQAAWLAAKPDVALVGCRVESFRAGGLREGFERYTDWANALVEPEAILREAFVDCPLPHPTWMIRREALARAGGYRDPGWAEDVDLFFRVLVAGLRVEKLPRVLHRWRDHDQRLSRRDPRYGREALARAKAHYLPRLWPVSGAVLLGAGRTARRYARLLDAEGLPIRALVRPDSGASPGTWRGIPVLGPETLADQARAWREAGVGLLGASALRGARERIRHILCELGLVEGRDFLMLA
jgi:glycosyltransferase involved in cell wall biosynthesis